MWHWHGEGDWGAGDWVSMALMMLFIWLPILLVGFFLVRALAGPRGQSDERQEPAEEHAAPTRGVRSTASGSSR